MSGFIGISCSENARFSDFWDSLVHLDTCQASINISSGGNIASNRNALTEKALSLGADWIFYVDDDQIFNPNTLRKLVDRDVDVVSGLYVGRNVPFEPVAYDKEDERGFVKSVTLENTHSGMLEVKAVGAGALLARCNVFKNLEKPYWRLGQTNNASLGEDIDFCQRVRKTGAKIFVDLDVCVGHKLMCTIWPTKNYSWETIVGVGNKPISWSPLS